MEKVLHDLMAYEGIKLYQNKDFLSFSIEIKIHFTHSTSMSKVLSSLTFKNTFLYKIKDNKSYLS